MSENSLYTKNINYSSSKLAAFLQFIFLSTALSLWLDYLFRDNSTKEDHIFGYYCLCYFGPILLNTSLHSYEACTKQPVSSDKKSVANIFSAILNGIAGAAFLEFAIKSQFIPLIAGSVIYPLDPLVRAVQAICQLVAKKKPSQPSLSIQEATLESANLSEAWCSSFSVSTQFYKGYQAINPPLYLFGSAIWAYWSIHTDEGFEHFLGNLFFCANALTHLCDEWGIFQACLSICQPDKNEEKTGLLASKPA